MSNVTISAELKLNPAATKFAEGILAAATVNDKHQIEVKDLKLEALLPEGLTLADIKKVQAAERDFAHAAFAVTGALGQAHLKKHKDATDVELNKLGFGTSSVSVNYARTAETGVGENKSTKHGHLTGKLVSSASKTSTSLSAVKGFYHAEGAKLFGGK